MNTTFLNANHPQSVISLLKSEKGLPFKEILPVDSIAEELRNIDYRDRCFSPIDGSTISMPDTPENQAIYPQSRTQKKGAGFPLARIVTVTSHSTGAILDLAIGPWSGKGSGEHALLRKIMHVFKKGDVALGDSYYASFFLMAMLMRIGVDSVFPIHQARIKDFRLGKRLGKKDHLV